MDRILSVCIPTYNRIHYLRESMNVLLPQAEQLNIDVCVSDNHSTDGTGDYLKILSSQYKCLKYVIQPTNSGLEKNMIAAMSIATTKYILPIGDDEIIIDGALYLIKNELMYDHELVILDGWHVSADIKHKVRRHLPTTLRNSEFSNPIEAFKELWDKMPPGSFVVKNECLSILNDYEKFIGTSHAYTGVVWEYLAQKFKFYGKIKIKCLSEPVILFRSGEKSWRRDAAKIMLYEIPQWFLKLPKEYQQVVTGILGGYLSKQSTFISLLGYRAMGQLSVGFINNFMLVFSERDKKRALLVARIPVNIVRIIVMFRKILGGVKRWILGQNYHW